MLRAQLIIIGDINTSIDNKLYLLFSKHARLIGAYFPTVPADFTLDGTVGGCGVVVELICTAARSKVTPAARPFHLTLPPGPLTFNHIPQLSMVKKEEGLGMTSGANLKLTVEVIRWGA